MSLERDIAGRYLKRPTPRSPRWHLITLGLVSVALAARGLEWAWSRGWIGRAHDIFAPAPIWPTFFRWLFIGGLVTAVLVGFLILLLRHLTIFTAISTYGLFLGTAALVVVLSVMSGFEQDLKQKILGANAHIVVTTPNRPFLNHQEIEAKIEAAIEGKIAPFISSEVMVSSQSNLAGVVLKGIDPESASGVTELGKNMKQGSIGYLAHPEKIEAVGNPLEDPPLPLPAAPRRVLPGLIVGRELAKSLRLFVGDEVNVISPMGDIGPAGPMPKSRAFRIAGVFFSGMYEYDTKSAYMALGEAQRFLGLEDEITGIEARIADADRTEAAVDRIRAALPGGDFEVRDWKELNRNLFSALRVEKIAMFVVLCFVILVAGFSIVANGFMLVREKRRDIAILKAMGAGDGKLMRLFLYMGSYMGAIGIGAGVLTGTVACLLLRRYGLISLDSNVYYISQLPVQMDVREIIAVVGAALTIVLAATILPALEAAHLRPVDGLRQDQG